MEIIIDFSDLGEIFILHLSSSYALFARTILIREKNLVDDDVVDIYIEFGKLNGKSLRLVKGEELRDAHSNKGGLLRILELGVHIFDFLFEAIKSIKNLFLEIFRVCLLALSSHHSLHTS